MSNEMSQPSQRNDRSLMGRLESVYSRYQQRHVYDKLDDIAATMEDTLLQTVIAEELFETSIEIGSDTKRTVREAQKKLAQESEGTDQQVVIEETELKRLETAVENEAESITNDIHEARVQLLSTVTAMEALNAEVGLVDGDELADLATLLDEWNWRTHIDDEKGFEARRQAAINYASELRDVLDRTQEKIGSGFDGDEIESLVETLLDGKPLSLAELSPDQRNALANSTLGDHLTISLG